MFVCGLPGIIDAPMIYMMFHEDANISYEMFFKHTWIKLCISGTKPVEVFQLATLYSLTGSNDMNL